MTEPMLIAVLVLSAGVPEATLAALRERFDVIDGRDSSRLTGALDRHGPRIRAIATTGKARLDRDLITALPKLEIVASYSAGLDNIDVDALRERGVVLTNSSGALANEVADLAVTLLVMARRRLVLADRHVRSGDWERQPYPLGRSVTGLRIGILGLGAIGSAIARRAEAMGMVPRYCNRRPITGCALPYHPSAIALARDSDILVVACPGGEANRGIVDAHVIHALGPEATLVNIARGEIVDQDALIEALTSGRLGSAGLDVLADEPHAPLALTALPNVVLTPHVGSATVETRAAMGESVVASLVRHFGLLSRPAATP